MAEKARVIRRKLKHARKEVKALTRQVNELAIKRDVLDEEIGDIIIQAPTMVNDQGRLAVEKAPWQPDQDLRVDNPAEGTKDDPAGLGLLHTATRFLDRLLPVLRLGVTDHRKATEVTARSVDTNTAYKLFAKMIGNEDTKRLLFDAKQAALFDEVGEGPPPHMLDKIKPVFPQFYMEFTEPVFLMGQEPERRDTCRAMLFVHDVVELQMKDQFAEGYLPSKSMITQVTMFLVGEDGSMVERTWKIATSGQWKALSLAISARDTGSFVPEEIEDHTYILAGEPIRFADGRVVEREIGWWEHVVVEYTQLMSWVLIYLMAKSIVVVPEKVTRQQRRWQERKGHTPNPWHVIDIDPKILLRWGGQQQGSEGEGTGSQHSYRYDVIGHLRFGKHKTKDGYSHTVEWVAAHQRGLANETYIPAVHRAKAGKVPTPRMNEYFGTPREEA